MMAEKRSSECLSKEEFKMSMGKRSTKAAIAEKKLQKAREIQAGGHSSNSGGRVTGSSLLALAIACVLVAQFAGAAENIPPAPNTRAARAEERAQRAFERAEQAQEMQQEIRRSLGPTHFDAGTRTVYQGNTPLDQLNADIRRQTRYGQEEIRKFNAMNAAERKQMFNTLSKSEREDYLSVLDANQRKEFLNSLDNTTRTQYIGHMTPEMQREYFDTLDWSQQREWLNNLATNEQAQIMGWLAPAQRREIFTGMNATQRNNFLNGLNPYDRREFIDFLPASERQEYLKNLAPMDRDAIERSDRIVNERSSATRGSLEPFDMQTYQARYNDIEQRRMAQQSNYTQKVRNLESRMSGLDRNSSEYKRLEKEVRDADKELTDADRKLGEEFMELESRRPNNFNLMLNR